MPLFRTQAVHYHEPLFRPPAEADSLIFQLTLGCSWNRCSFCEMYTTKHFRIRPENELFEEITAAAGKLPHTRKIFLADGNPMILSHHKLLRIIDHLKKNFPKLRRVSAYALPSDLLSKPVPELVSLRLAGLSLLYTGIESGDDEVLKRNHKGETAASTLEGLLQAKEAGFKLSVMILNGLGGELLSRQHAENSAVLLNKLNPELLSTLVLSFPFGLEHFRKRFDGPFSPLTKIQLLEEMGVLIDNTRLKDCIFRSDHASNYLVLSGILDRDRQSLTDQIRSAIAQPVRAGLRPEWMRGL